MPSEKEQQIQPEHTHTGAIRTHLTVLPNQATQDKVYILTFFSFFYSLFAGSSFYNHRNRYRDGTVSDVNQNRRRTDQLRCFALLQLPKKQQAPPQR